jgi:hypothetical protein
MLAPLRGGHRHGDDRAASLPEILPNFFSKTVEE